MCERLDRYSTPALAIIRTTRYGTAGWIARSCLCFSNPWFLSRKEWIRSLIWSFDKEGYSAGRG